MFNIWQEFLVLAAAHLLAVASPGPDFYIVTKNTIKHGKLFGRVTALGVGLAILLHITYVLLGFTILIKSSPQLFTIVKWIGAAYLVYIGTKSLLQKQQSTKEDIKSMQNEITLKTAFLEGFFTNALNVKAMLFFFFLFTTIVSEHTPLSIKIGYGLWLSLSTFLWFFGIASFVGKSQIRTFFLRFGLWFDRLMGLILILLSIILLYTKTA